MSFGRSRARTRSRSIRITWLFVPCDAGCVLVRDEAATRQAFEAFSEYTAVTQTEPVERFALFDHGLEMSRRVRGLQVWMVLDARVAAEPRLEPLGSELSIACVRVRPAGIDDVAAIDRVNRTMVETLVADALLHVPDHARRPVRARACIVNFRTTDADIDLLTDEVLRIGQPAPAPAASNPRPPTGRT
jgi:glutamate/tyrosine decarboxylase-like PLP-dependent enzyme